MSGSDAFVHPTALVEDGAVIGPGSRVWHHAQVRTRAQIGANCIVGKGVFIDFDVIIGDDCKFQNYACVYHGVTLGRGVFVGPHVVFTNDSFPRATSPDFTPLKDGEWVVGESTVGDGASIGANATVVPGVQIGAWALVGAGAIVTKNVPSYALVIGSPARFHKWVCKCGRVVESSTCSVCGELPSDHPLHESKA